MDISDSTPIGLSATSDRSNLPLILLVEDNPGDVQLLQEAFLERHIPVRFVTASSASQASGLRMLLRSPALPSLIVMDLGLPMVSGHDLLRGFATDPHWCRIPSLVLTSSDRESDRAASKSAGATAHLIKPASYDEYLRLADLLAGYLPQERCAS